MRKLAIGYLKSEKYLRLIYHLSPGSVAEILCFFVAEYASDMQVNEGGGVGNGEDIVEVLELKFDKAPGMVQNGDIQDGKTIMLLQFAQINHLFRT